MMHTNDNTLLKRVQVLSTGRQFSQIPNGPVMYWMNRDQRVQDNWGLVYAQKKAENMKTTVIVVFCLQKNYLGAGEFHYRFMVEGLKETALCLQEIGIPFHLIMQSPETALPALCDEWNTPLLVTDFSPLRIKREWEHNIGTLVRCPVHQVDSHNIVPCWEASHKPEYAAYTFRPRILKKLDEFLVEYPDLNKQKYEKVWESNDDWMTQLPSEYKINERYPKTGTKAAKFSLDNFINGGIRRYASYGRNPLEYAVSKLSPYLHFGQLSPARCAIEAMKQAEVNENRENFLEQLIVRRELSDNFCYYQPFYDNILAFPDWARHTLSAHQHDHREYLYTLTELEHCLTHEALWNATQTEMKLTGYLHGYLRMYWAKKIVEWTPNAEIAQQYAIYLNDKYLLDGRDPNGYAGIAWSVGGVHDRAWADRLVFGKIRYMNEKGCRRKFDVDGYIDYVGNLAVNGGKQHEPFR